MNNKMSLGAAWKGIARGGLLGGCLLLWSNAWGLSVFINEIHYDNSGGDTGEGLEIAGPAGTDLSDWSLVFYNGVDGELYKAEVLSGAIADQQNGFGVHSVSVTGIQNGPDGVALVNAADAVEQFLSYEGAFTATNGPAAGQMSVDIGVSESSGTPAGHSLQLAGMGFVYPDFAWTAASPNTFGQINTDQAFLDSGGTTPVSAPGAGILLATSLLMMAAVRSFHRTSPASARSAGSSEPPLAV